MNMQHIQSTSLNGKAERNYLPRKALECFKSHKREGNDVFPQRCELDFLVLRDEEDLKHRIAYEI